MPTHSFTEEDVTRLRPVKRLKTDGQGFQHFTPDPDFILTAVPGAAKRAPLTEPSAFSGKGGIGGYFCSPAIESLMREEAQGFIDTFDFRIDKQGLDLHPELENGRLVNVLGAWQPFDLARSELRWIRDGDWFEIGSAERVIFRNDIPHDLGIIRPMFTYSPIYFRDRFFDRLAEITSKPARRRPIHSVVPIQPADNPPWWRN